MNTMTKKGSMLVLALLMMIMSVYVPFKQAEAAMTYNNTSNAYLSGSVDSNGNLNAALCVYGKSGVTTRIDVELYVDKQFLGIFWTRVNIGYPNNVWTDYTTHYSYNNNFSTHLDSTGTYRITVTYTVSGTGGSADVIIKTSTVTY